MVAKSEASTCAILTTAGTLARNSPRGSVLLKTRRQRHLVVKLKTKRKNENVCRAC